MSDGYKPTMNLRWFETSKYNNVVPVTVIYKNKPEYYKFQQLWVSDFEGEADEWRDIETANE